MQARLEIINGDDRGRNFALSPDRVVTLGRHHASTILLRDEFCSRKHAEVRFESGQWVLHDLNSENGTYLDGVRINQVELAEESEIRIGKVKLRFSVGALPQDARPTMPMPKLGAAKPPAAGDEPASHLLSDTAFEADELAAICQFMADAVNLGDARALVGKALETVRTHTKADFAAFLGLSQSGVLLSRHRFPATTSLDARESKSLTERAERERKPIWLSRECEQPSGDSLLQYRDAVCVPLSARDGLLGTLHVYRHSGPFTDHAFKFSIVIAAHLASSLRLLRERERLELESSRFPVATELVGTSSVIEALRKQIEQASRQISPRASVMLIRGETGVGKELVARALQRRAGPFVSVNCAAIPGSLLESELYGHKKGAFTNAVADYKGCFERADDGTLFLDEVGELPLDQQPKLLRVLDGYPFTPIGESEEIVVNVRTIAATNRDLEQQVKEGKFRQDLYYRLNGIEIRVPPLREHLEDIPALTAHFLKQLCAHQAEPVNATAAALERLARHPWPGNVRELQKTLERSVVWLTGNTLDAADLRFIGSAAPGEAPPSLNLNELEHWAILQALKQTGHKITQTAKLLGISRSTLYARAEHHGIKYRETEKHEE